MATLPKKKKRKWDHSRKRKSNPFYKSKQWRADRNDHVSKVIYCDCGCGQINKEYGGRATIESDHIIPIRLGGDRWARENRQGLTKSCHGKKSHKESQGLMYAYTGRWGERVPIRPLRWKKVEPSDRGGGWV